MAPMIQQSTRGFASLFIPIQTMLNVCVSIELLLASCGLNVCSQRFKLARTLAP
jgi:hypothetical protein